MQDASHNRLTTANLKKKPFYSAKLSRLLFDSNAAQSIGQDAVLLVLCIASKEDETWYRGPVSFWNNQIDEKLGFRSPKTINNARRKAIEAGWLEYYRKNDRTNGVYLTRIPDDFMADLDQAGEMYDLAGETSLSVPSTESIPSTERETEQEGYALRNRKVTRNDPPPIPIPTPDPSPTSSSSSKVISFDESFSLENERSKLSTLAHAMAKIVASSRKAERCTPAEWETICRVAHVGLELVGYTSTTGWIETASSKPNVVAGYFASIAIRECQNHGEDFDVLKRDAVLLRYDPDPITKKVKAPDREKLHWKVYPRLKSQLGRTPTDDEVNAAIDAETKRRETA